MKKILTLGLLTLTAMVSVMTVAPFVQAEATSPTEAQCKVAQVRLTAQIVRVETVKTTQAKVYAAVQTKVDKIVTSASEGSYDTTAMVAAQTALAAKITAYTDASTAYATSLTTAKGTTCGASNTGFVTSVVATRTALTAARTAAVDVRTTIRSDVIPALKDYAAWLKDNTTTQETN